MKQQLGLKQLLGMTHQPPPRSFCSEILSLHLQELGLPGEWVQEQPLAPSQSSQEVKPACPASRHVQCLASPSISGRGFTLRNCICSCLICRLLRSGPGTRYPEHGKSLGLLVTMPACLWKYIPCKVKRSYQEGQGFAVEWLL